MSEDEVPQSRLRVGGWLPPYSSSRRDGGSRGAHRAEVPATAAPGTRTVAAAVPERRPVRPVLVAGAVAAVLIVGSAVVALRTNGPPVVVSVGAPQPALPPVAPTLSAASDYPPGASALPPLPVPPGRATRSPAAARPGRSRAAAPSADPGRGPTAAQPSATAGPRGVAPALAVGSTVSLAPASRPDERMRHSGSQVRVDLIRATNSAAVRADANFEVRAGLADPGCVSFELAEQPGRFLRHLSFVVLLQENDGGGSFGRDATFCQAAAVGGGISLRSKSDPDRFLAARGARVFLDRADRPTTSMIFLVRTPL